MPENDRRRDEDETGVGETIGQNLAAGATWLWNFGWNTVRCVWWLGFALAAGMLKLVVLFANYIGIQTAFYYANWEQKPLSADPLVGPWVGSLLGDVTLAAAFAFAATAMLGLLTYTVVHLVFEEIDLYGQYRAQASPATPRAEQARQNLVSRLWRNGVYVVLLGVPLIYLMYWDVTQFQFRTAVRAKGAKTPGAAADVASWSALSQTPEFTNEFLWVFADWSASAYLGMTVAAAILVEFSLRRSRDAFSILWNGTGLADMAERRRNEGAVQGGAERHRQANEEARDGARPAAEDPADEDEDAEGDWFFDRVRDGVAELGNLLPPGQDSTNGREESDDDERDAQQEGDTPLFEMGEEPTPDRDDDGEAVQGREIIGSPGEYATTSEALDDPELVVDPETDAVWDRALWEELEEGETR